VEVHTLGLPAGIEMADCSPRRGVRLTQQPSFRVTAIAERTHRSYAHPCDVHSDGP